MPPAFPTDDANFDAKTEEGYSNAARQLLDTGYGPVEAQRASDGALRPCRRTCQTPALQCLVQWGASLASMPPLSFAAPAHVHTYD